jgi:hypothetical protein
LDKYGEGAEYLVMCVSLGVMVCKLVAAFRYAEQNRYQHRDSFDIKLDQSEGSCQKKFKSYGSLDRRGDYN